jgi:hypothetical protein
LGWRIVSCSSLNLIVTMLPRWGHGLSGDFENGGKKMLNVNFDLMKLRNVASALSGGLTSRTSHEAEDESLFRPRHAVRRSEHFLRFCHLFPLSEFERDSKIDFITRQNQSNKSKDEKLKAKKNVSKKTCPKGHPFR